MRVAVVGGGISGVTAAWQMARLGLEDAALYEASGRMGGTVETARRDGFVIDMGPDGWVSEKPWAGELAKELGLGDELIGSNDAGRVTYIAQAGRLVAMPDAMRMMVPTELAALEGSPLFSDAARAAYAGEAKRAEALRAAVPHEDESIAAFVRRHFGEEVLAKVAGPLLSGVFGGDVERLSARAVMPRFVELEREHGSLVEALAGKGSASAQSVFTSLKSGVETMIERMVLEVPEGWLRMKRTVTGIERTATAWTVYALGDDGKESSERFDAVILAVPAHGAKQLLAPVDARIADLLEMDASSAALVSLAFDEEFELPHGFGFLVPPGQGSSLLAGTFVDQKYAHRVPEGCRLLRGFFGGETAVRLCGLRDEEVSALALGELRMLLGHLPEPKFSVARMWPRSLPQYGVGHLERMGELDRLVKEHEGLWLLGNAYHGVGLPDLARDARAAAKALVR